MCTHDGEDAHSVILAFMGAQMITDKEERARLQPKRTCHLRAVSRGSVGSVGSVERAARCACHGVEHVCLAISGRRCWNAAFAKIQASMSDTRLPRRTEAVARVHDNG